MELLSQLEYREKGSWEPTLRALEHSDLRPQWTRAWLIGPFASPSFENSHDQMSIAVFGNGAARLTKLVVWFQAEKTKPNPLVLQRAGSQDAAVTIRAADALAWPSDVKAWSRLIGWLLADPMRLPCAVAGDIVSVFEVWQHMLADTPNPRSSMILSVASTWLEDLEDRLHSETFSTEYGPWEGDSHRLKELEKRLRAIILRAGRAYPNRVCAYVERSRSRARLRGDAFSEVVSYAPILAEIGAALLVDYMLDETLNELPEVVAAQPIEAGDFFVPRINHHDWHTLSIGRDARTFNVASPVAQPFAALFITAPVEALRLVRRLCNHAISAWRQLHALNIDGSRRPIPLTLNFPWGPQTFWGDHRVYQWYRAVNGPKPVECGLMALETWALKELDAGRDMDKVIKDVLDGQECCAALGVAVSVILKGQCSTSVGAAFVASARLWSWDLRRWQQDSFPINLIASPLDWTDLAAVREGNAIPLRKLTLRSLVPIFVLAADDTVRSKVQEQIQGFAATPPIDFEEECEDITSLAEARRIAEIWSKMGDPSTYRITPAPEKHGIIVRHESPHAADEDVLPTQRNAEEVNERAALRVWVSACLEQERIAESILLEDAIQRARCLDAVDLFIDVHPDDFPRNMTRSAVAGVAAVALSFGKMTEHDVRWAHDVMLRAARTHEPSDPSFAARAIVPDHPCVFAARGLRAIVVSSKGGRLYREQLLTLATHPLEEVSATALGEAMACWDFDPALSWAALDLGLRLSVGRWDEPVSPYGYDHTSNRKRVQRVLRAAIRKMHPRSKDFTLVALPPAWMKLTLSERERWPKSRRPQPPMNSGWRAPDEFLRWDFLPKVLRRAPVGKLLADPQRRSAFLALCDHLVCWTLQQLVPPWQGEDSGGRRRQESAQLFEWRSELFRFLADVALAIDAREVISRFLHPVFALEDEIAFSLIEPFVRRLVAAGIHDPQIIPQPAVPLLDACMERVLSANDWKRASWWDGDIHGHHLPSLVRDLLFVGCGDAGGASRFSNGDWRDISVIMPFVRRLVGAVGHVPQVASAFFTLCERSSTHFPPNVFADLCRAMMEKGQGAPVGWRGHMLPARMASLVQVFAEKSQPIDPRLAQDFLRLLDALVDMGDRRSAALQISEVFKDVRVNAQSNTRTLRAAC